MQRVDSDLMIVLLSHRVTLKHVTRAMCDVCSDTEVSLETERANVNA